MPPPALDQVPGPAAPAGLRVWVYRNLHLPGRAWSVRNPATGRVVARTGEVFLTDARLVVQPGGRARARAEGRRNVHAYAAGVVTDTPADHATLPWRAATYRPFTDDTFTDVGTGHPIGDAALVWLGPHGLAYLPAADRG